MISVVQVYDGDGSGGPTEEELRAKKAAFNRRRLLRAKHIADLHDITVEAEDYQGHSPMANSDNHDEILLLKIEEEYGTLVEE